MARENRDQWTDDRTGADPRHEAAAPPPPPPPTPPVPGAAGAPATPLSRSPLSAAPSDEPGATGRNDGSPQPTPAVAPAAPRGRTTTDPLAHAGPAPGPGERGGDGRGAHPGNGAHHASAVSTRKEPGRGAGRASGAGTGPGSGLGFVPGTASGSDRDTDRAPGAGAGTDPGQGPGAGHGPGTAPGTESGFGTSPAADPGYGTGPAADGGLAQGSDRAHGQGQGGAAPEPLLDGTDRDRLGRRMHHALAGFVDSPHDAVAEAAEVLDEVEKQLIASLQDRRAALREGWQGKGASGEGGVDTERLRLTLRTYREVTERLLAT